MQRAFFQVLVVFMFLALSINAQNQGYIQVQAKVFDKDSLKGFEEDAARRSALSEHFFGSEYKVRMYQLKREYINNKYNLWPKYEPVVMEPSPRLNKTQSFCQNLDFESSIAGSITSSGQITGWVVEHGSNGNVWMPGLPPPPLNPTVAINSCNLVGCCTVAPQEAEIIAIPSGGYIDPEIGAVYPIFSVFGHSAGDPNAESANPHIQNMFGDNVIRINSNLNNNSITKLSKTFTVDPSSVLLQFAFITVFSTGHSCCDAGAFKTRVVAPTSASTTTCPGFSVSALSSQCSNTNSGVAYFVPGTGAPATVNSGNVFNKWKIGSIDLSSYVGQVVSLEFIVTDCIAGGHFGYVYLDMNCGFKGAFNGIDLNVISDTTNLISCKPTTNLSAPQGVNSVLWQGPNGFTSTASTINPGTAGIYTLDYIDALGCNSTKIFKFITSTTAVAVTSDPTICVGAQAVLGVSGTHNFHWNTGDITANIMVSPSVTTTYTATSTDGNECTATVAITQTVDNCYVGIVTKSNETNFAMYPNPNNGQFYVDAGNDTKDGLLIIENTLGQKVHSRPIVSGENAIKIDDLPAGIYYCSIIENKKVVFRKPVQIR